MESQVSATICTEGGHLVAVDEIGMTESHDKSGADSVSATVSTGLQLDSDAVEGPEVIQALLAKNEEVYSRVVRAHHSSMVRVAMAYVANREAAEEVAQEVWTVLVEGLHNFQGKSTLKTWLYGILLNRAKTRGQRDSRQIPISSFESEETGRCELLENAASSEVRSPGRAPWVWGNSSKTPSPEARSLQKELDAYRAKAIALLPYRQRVVITLRDIEGWSSKEVCRALGLQPTHQRVLLHRARVRVREVMQEFSKRSKGR